MMADIAALQYMYGANFGGSSSTYTWSSTTGEMFINRVGQGALNNGAGGVYNRIFLTIWDNGGSNDIYDLFTRTMFRST
jgi:serralysin